MEPPEVVTLHVWGVAVAAVPLAMARMALDRPLMSRTPALFSKLLGTGDGGTFRLRDADPRHWAVLATWSSASAAAAFETSPTVRGWERIARERLAVTLRPLSSKGRWDGRRPFGAPAPRRVRGPVASLTRARIRPTRATRFRAAVPAVASDLRQHPGLRLSLAVGEAPVGRQGTFSIWEDSGALVDFAHRRAAHAEVVRRTVEERWYAEELFARFEVLEIGGRLRGRNY